MSLLFNNPFLVFSHTARSRIKNSQFFRLLLDDPSSRPPPSSPPDRFFWPSHASHGSLPDYIERRCTTLVVIRDKTQDTTQSFYSETLCPTWGMSALFVYTCRSPGLVTFPTILYTFSQHQPLDIRQNPATLLMVRMTRYVKRRVIAVQSRMPRGVLRSSSPTDPGAF